MVKNGIDELDEEILKYLETDARKSLKKLADDLNKKTSTIYHRLQRMQNNNIILGYSVIYNPEVFKYKKIGELRIDLKPHNIKGFDDVFVISFAKYLKEEFNKILFISILENLRQIMCLVPFVNDEDLNNFVTELKNNAYVENINVEFFHSIIKGQKLFNFDKSLMKKSNVENR